MSGSAADKSQIVAIAAPADARALAAADAQLREIYRRREGPPVLVTLAPTADPAGQARALFDAKGTDTTAALYGPLDRPSILYAPVSVRHGDYLARLAEEVLRDRKAGATATLSTPAKTAVGATRTGTSARGEGQAAFFAVFGIFILTLMLAGQAVGTMAEERSNKVIEVLAAAVPLESVFLGKLVGMFGVAILFVAFWGTIAVNIGQVLPAPIARSFSDIGRPSGRSSRCCSSPISRWRTCCSARCSSASAHRHRRRAKSRCCRCRSPSSRWRCSRCRRPPRRSPTAGSRASPRSFRSARPSRWRRARRTGPELWPHVAALGWQLLWVALTIAIGARLFRRGVLQSGSPPFWKRGRTARALEAGSHLPPV